MNIIVNKDLCWSIGFIICIRIPTSTLVLKLTSQQSATVIQVTIQTNGHPNIPGPTIRNLISPHQVLLLNYGRADTWYFASNSFNAEDLDGTTKQHGPYTLIVSINPKDKINGTLRWVPPMLSNETLLNALRIVSKLGPTVTAIPFTNNRKFTIYSDNPSTIPHYISSTTKTRLSTF